MTRTSVELHYLRAQNIGHAEAKREGAAFALYQQGLPGSLFIEKFGACTCPVLTGMLLVVAVWFFRGDFSSQRCDTNARREAGVLLCALFDLDADPLTATLKLFRCSDAFAKSQHGHRIETTFSVATCFLRASSMKTVGGNTERPC